MNRVFLCVAVIIWLLSGSAGFSQTDDQFMSVFRDAKKVDLRTCKAGSVVKLRDVVKIPPSGTPILVKTFTATKLPDVLKSSFSRPGTLGVTINGKYIAILKTEFQDEYRDVLNHELVHAYITLACPKPLNFSFQEASAVYFSTNTDQKLYGKPNEKKIGVTDVKAIKLPDDYSQKLGNFQFLVERVGQDKFFTWYRSAVMTGHVDARPLLGFAEEPKKKNVVKGGFGGRWMAIAAGGVIIGVIVIGIVVARRSVEYE